MRSVTYSMGVSLDGYIAGPDGGFDWTAPDEELFRFVTDEIRQVGVHLLGRRLYETMLYWETADQDPSLDDSMLEWAAIWKPLPKVVFSATLSAVQGNARLASGGLAEEIERLRAEPAEGSIAIGGAALAGEAAARGVIDEYRARVRTFPGASAGWTSNSSRPAPSARESSTSATAWRASRLVRRARGRKASQWLDLNHAALNHAAQFAQRALEPSRFKRSPRESASRRARAAELTQAADPGNRLPIAFAWPYVWCCSDQMPHP